MAKTDLLKQAIADAKAVKETALANAKLALQEAFQPTMMRMISDQIENEVDVEEEMPAEEPEMDMSAEEQGMEGDAGMENDFNWTDDHLSASVGGNDYDFTVGMDVEDELEPEANDEDMDAEYADTDAVANDDNLDLESIIRELEEDLDAEPEMEVDMEEPNMTDEGMYYESHDYGHSEDDAEEDSLKDIIEAILREEEMMPPADDELTAEDMDMVEPIKAELEEAYKTVRQLRSIINEVNLLNAKLLFTNKLFRNFELSENQKMKVIENFDRAGNPREVKLVFTTLAESFKRPTTKKRVVKESAASRPTRTTAPSRQTTQVLTEGFELANRWKKLAGLL
jgi:hypothetical protein